MNPIERLVAAGHAPILEAAGWIKQSGEWQYWTAQNWPLAPDTVSKVIIARAGMAALEWLIREGREPINQDHYEVTGLYDMDVQVNGPDEYRNFESLTLAEALIDAAIAVWEVSRG